VLLAVPSRSRRAATYGARLAAPPTSQVGSSRSGKGG